MNDTAPRRITIFGSRTTGGYWRIGTRGGIGPGTPRGHTVAMVRCPRRLAEQLVELLNVWRHRGELDQPDEQPQRRRHRRTGGL